MEREPGYKTKDVNGNAIKAKLQWEQTRFDSVSLRRGWNREDAVTVDLFAVKWMKAQQRGGRRIEGF